MNYKYYENGVTDQPGEQNHRGIIRAAPISSQTGETMYAVEIIGPHAFEDETLGDGARVDRTLTTLETVETRIREFAAAKHFSLIQID